MVAHNILGLPIPDEGTVFYVALAIHIAAAITCVIAGALAASARKRAGRHPRAGLVYLYGLGFVAATAAIMAAIRLREDAPLLAIAIVAFGLGLFGWLARRRRRPGWPVRHAVGMGGSYIALLTGFYVDNGPHLPLWDRLPHARYWVLPAGIGLPRIWWALRRFHAGLSTRPRVAASSGAQPAPPS